MRMIVMVLLVSSALAVPAAAQTPVTEGCIVTPQASCEYTASRPGSILAVGDWTVEVWWEGECGSGSADYTRSSNAHTAHPASPSGDNNVGGVAGAWEGTVAPDACARVSTGDGIALVGAALIP